MLWNAVDAAIKVEWLMKVVLYALEKEVATSMRTYEHTEFVYPDQHVDDPNPIDTCQHIDCQRAIYRDEKNWELFGAWFCSAVCVARHVDAKRMYPDQISDGQQ